MPEKTSVMRRDFRWQALCLALLVGAHAAVNYTGDFCAGVVDFPLKDGSNIAALDLNAEGLVSQFPRWVDKGCWAAVWKFACMAAYGPAADDEEGYCQGSCLKTLDDCAATIDLLGDQASTYIIILQASCFSQPATPTCHPGGDVTYQNVPDDYQVFCPEPLGLAEPRDGLQMEKLEGTACALPCPPISFTHDEWYTVRAVGKWCALASAVLSVMIVLTHREEKNLHIRYLSAGAAVMNAMIFVLLVVDDYDAQVCVDDVHYHKATPLCFTTAITTVAGFAWLFGWQACIALHLWLSVVLQVKRNDLDKIKSYFLPGVTAFAFLCPIICASVDNLGYDWRGYSGPICLFLVGEDDTYYWSLFFAPICVVLATCLGLMVHTIYHVNAVVGSAANARQTSPLQRLLRIISLNRRMFLFVGCFSLLGLYQAGSILHEKFIDPRNFVSSAEDYVACLMTNAGDSPNDGRAVCGDHPSQRPYLWRVALLITYAASIGILAFLVYGTQNKMSKTVSQGLRTLRTSLASENKDRGPASTSPKGSTTSKFFKRSYSKKHSSSDGREHSDTVEVTTAPIEPINEVSVEAMIEDDEL